MGSYSREPNWPMMKDGERERERDGIKRRKERWIASVAHSGRQRNT